MGRSKPIQPGRLRVFADWYVLASDGGVDIPGLGKKWDILRNQRIVGENNTDLKKAEKLLDLMKDLKGEKKSRLSFSAGFSQKGKTYLGHGTNQ